MTDSSRVRDSTGTRAHRRAVVETVLSKAAAFMRPRLDAAAGDRLIVRELRAQRRRRAAFIVAGGTVAALLLAGGVTALRPTTGHGPASGAVSAC